MSTVAKEGIQAVGQITSDVVLDKAYEAPMGNILVLPSWPSLTKQPNLYIICEAWANERSS